LPITETKLDYPQLLARFSTTLATQQTPWYLQAALEFRTHSLIKLLLNPKTASLCSAAALGATDFVAQRFLQ
jgi:hypothetical protein